jgi:hypothetical protein
MPMTRPAKKRRKKQAPRKPRKRAFDPEITADALRIWRTTKNITDPIWTQEYTAFWLGVSVRMYRRWETGNWPVPLYVSLRIIEREELLQDIALLKRTLHNNNIPSPL